jgi:hypothetical protein
VRFNRAPTGIRNRALIVVLHRGGLRSGEMLHRPHASCDDGPICEPPGTCDLIFHMQQRDWSLQVGQASAAFHNAAHMCRYVRLRAVWL